jgi:exodeoxyribonuclease-3
MFFEMKSEDSFTKSTYLAELLRFCTLYIYMSVVKIYSWNVNGIRAVWNKGLLQDFIEKHDPDILCLQETKAHPDQSSVDLPHFQEFWCPAEKKGYSGTAIFTKNAPLAVRNGLPEDIVERFNLSDTYGDTSKEGRVIAAEYLDYWVVSVYTPNAKDDLSRIPMRQAWDPAFLAYLKLLETTKPVIVGGDFNVAYTELDLARPKENRGKKGFTDEERAGMTAYHEAGFIDTLRYFYPNTGDLYTWWSHWGQARARNIGWRIDYFLTSAALKDRLSAAHIHPAVLGSDHCPVSVEIKQ